MCGAVFWGCDENIGNTAMCDCAHTELGGVTAGTADPRGVPDPVVFCSAVKTGEEAGRKEHLELVFPSHS